MSKKIKSGLVLFSTPQSLNPFSSSLKEYKNLNIFIKFIRINHKNSRLISPYRYGDIKCLGSIIINNYSFIILSSGSGFMQRPLLTKILLFIARKKNINVYVWWGSCSYIFDKVHQRVGEKAFKEACRIMSSELIKYHFTLTPKAAKDLKDAAGINNSLLTHNCTIKPNNHNEIILPEEDPIILNISSVQHRKGPDLFVNIAELVCKQHETAKFIWVGGYADKDTSKLIAQKQLDKRVMFVGKANPPWQWIDKSSMMLFSTRSDAFGVVIIEAMARKRTVLCFADTGPDTVIKDTGIVVPQWDIRQAAEEILLLINKPPADRINYRTQETFLKFYSPEAYAIKLADIIHNPESAKEKYQYVV